MHFLEERIDELENQLRNHEDILRRLAQAIKPDHNESCEFNDALKNVESKAFSNLHIIYHYYCKNKQTQL